MYDNYINDSKFREIKSLIHGYADYSEEYNGLTIEEIGERTYQYYTDGLISSSQYDYINNLIEELE